MSEVLLIKTPNSISGVESEHEVPAWPTASPYFVITPFFPDKSRFVVTHKQSTCAAAGPFKELRNAELIAAIFGSLPVPWDSYSVDVAEQLDNEKEKKRFRDEWEKLPDELRKWQRDIANACSEGWL